VHPGDFVWSDAEQRERLDVRRLGAGAAHDADPSSRGGERVAEHDAEFFAVMVGHHYVTPRIGNGTYRWPHIESSLAGLFGELGIGLDEHRPEASVGREMQQVLSDGGGEHSN